MAILNQTQEERVLNWINSNGEVVIPPEYDSDQSSVYHGVLVLKKNGKYGG